MTRHFVVGRTAHTWPGMGETAKVVVEFLTRVRVTGDANAAEEVMAAKVLCHQMTSERPETIERSPADYAEHVRDMLAACGPFTYTVTEFLTEDDRAYVRWRQDGHHVLSEDGHPGTRLPLSDVGSAVYRVEDGKIAEYWIQLDRMGLSLQLGALSS